MESKYFDSFTLIVIGGGLGVVVLGLALRQVESMQKNIPLWLFTGLMGILLGGGATMVAMHGIGYHWTKQPVSEVGVAGQQMSMSGMGGPMNTGGGPGMGGGMGGGPPGMGGGPPGMGGGMGGGMPGMGGGMPGMGGGGGGAGATPPARRTLPALIGKIDLVLGGLQLKLDDERAAKLAASIKGLEDAEEMTEESAKDYLDAINDLLTDQEKEILASFNLPAARQGGGGGGPGGMGGGFGGGGPGGGGRGGPGGGGGGGQASNDNPFKQEDNAKRLQSLRERFGAPAAETKSGGDTKPEEKPKE